MGGTPSCLHHPSFCQALPAVAVAVVAVDDDPVAVGAVGAVAVPEMVRHRAYVVLATTATLEQAPWMDNWTLILDNDNIPLDIYFL